MVQPATAVLEPDDNDQPEACSAGLAWCLGECADYDGHYHGSDFAAVDAAGHHHAAAELSVSIHREDRDDEIGPVQISILTRHDDLVVTAAAARQFAAHLMNAADTVDPLPAGVTVTTVSALRLGDDLLTDDGWQTIQGLVFFADCGQASVFTDERDDENSDGWQLQVDDAVKARRSGGLVLQFLEPLS